MKFTDKLMYKRIYCKSMPYEWAIPIQYEGGGKYTLVHKRLPSEVGFDILVVPVYEENTWKLYK